MIGLRRKLPSTGSLFVFEAAARHGNFSRAGAELNVTQPAISRAVQELEGHLGVALFTRGRAGVTLTEAGQRLAQLTSRSFAEIGAELDAMTRGRAQQNVVTLSVSTAFAAHWLMPRMDVFRAEFPEVDVRFQLIAGPVGGPVGDVDLAMRYLPDPPPAAIAVMHEAHVPVCAPALHEAARAGRAKAIRFAAQPAGGGQFGGPGIALGDYSVVLTAALAGQGVAEGWINIVAQRLLDGGLVACGDVTRTNRLCCLHVRPGALKAALAARIAQWVVAQTHADLRALACRFPAWGVLDLIPSDAGTP